MMLASRGIPMLGTSHGRCAGPNLARVREMNAGNDFGRRPVILLDLDNTIVDWDAEFAARWTLKNAHAPSIADRKHFEIEANFPKEHENDVLEVIAEPGFYRNLKPFPGAIEAVKEMVGLGYFVRFCTSTHPVCHSTCAAEKLEWVEAHLGQEYVKLAIITADKTAVKGSVLVDDKPSVTGCFQDPDWTHVLYDMPYNGDTNKPRIKHWGEWKKTLLPILEQASAQ